MSDQPTLTTAAVLNDFRLELFEGGYPDEQIGELAAIALHALLVDSGQPLIVHEPVMA